MVQCHSIISCSIFICYEKQALFFSQLTPESTRQPALYSKSQQLYTSSIWPLLQQSFCMHKTKTCCKWRKVTSNPHKKYSRIWKSFGDFRGIIYFFMASWLKQPQTFLNYIGYEKNPLCKSVVPHIEKNHYQDATENSFSILPSQFPCSFYEEKVYYARCHGD